MDGGGNKEKIESTAMGGFSVARRRRRRDVRFNWAGGSHTRSRGIVEGRGGFGFV